MTSESAVNTNHPSETLQKCFHLWFKQLAPKLRVLAKQNLTDTMTHKRTGGLHVDRRADKTCHEKWTRSLELSPVTISSHSVDLRASRIHKSTSKTRCAWFKQIVAHTNNQSVRIQLERRPRLVGQRESLKLMTDLDLQMTDNSAPSQSTCGEQKKSCPNQLLIHWHKTPQIERYFNWRRLQLRDRFWLISWRRTNLQQGICYFGVNGATIFLPFQLMYTVVHVVQD